MSDTSPVLAIPSSIPEFDEALLRLSATFINVAPDRVDGEIENGLARLAEAMGGDRATIAVIDPRSGDLVVTHSWARLGFPAIPKTFSERCITVALPTHQVG